MLGLTKMWEGGGGGGVLPYKRSSGKAIGRPTLIHKPSQGQLAGSALVLSPVVGDVWDEVLMNICLNSLWHVSMGPQDSVPLVSSWLLFSGASDNATSIRRGRGWLPWKPVEKSLIVCSTRINLSNLIRW